MGSLNADSWQTTIDLWRARSEPARGDLAKAKTNRTSVARLHPQLDYALPWPPRSTRPRAAQG